MNRYIIVDNCEECCGCGACKDVCSKSAIEMRPDEMGFLYPKINLGKCIDCGLCTKVCSFNSAYSSKGQFEEPVVYGCRCSDEKELLKSQSGGAAFAIASQFIKQGGVVYGVAMEDTYAATHVCCNTIEELQRTRFSKYIQSDLRNTFHEILKQLQQKNVLFIGSPCQVAGLKSFVNIKSRILLKNLYTCDLVCHAVPSPEVWKRYCLYLEKKNKSALSKALFRNKKYGWHSHYETFVFDNKKTKTYDFFKSLFYSHLIVRESCSVCPFTNMRRVGDVTCGDFWGWEKTHKEWNDNKGVSLCLINSERGYQLFNDTIELIKIQSSTTECIQPQLTEPIRLSKDYDVFKKLFKEKGIECVLRKYTTFGFYNKTKKRIKNITTRIINKIK